MQADPEGLFNLLQQHLSWYPLMEPRDIYKLLYQGVMGSEHLVNSPEEFTRRLRFEFEPLLADPNQRMLELLRPDQSLFRLNLRAYKTRQVGVDLLTPALLETSQLIAGSKTELLLVWAEFEQLCEQGHFGNFKIYNIHQFHKWLAQMDFPAVHHSNIYRREYQPSYRLISAKFIPGLGLTNAG